MRKEPEMKQNLAGVTQFLRHAPAQYRAFGPYWWSIKRLVREHYPEMFHWAHGGSDDPIAREQVEEYYGDEQAILEAACEHCERMVVQGTPTSGSGSMPDGSPYQLHDPDMGPANLPA